jgi:capsular polysaccharide export protein
LRQEVELLTGLQPVLGLALPPRGAAIAGWGHKPTANRARRLARARGIPYIAIEDGFLRSVKPGRDMRPLAMVMDRSGIYYDARGPSDLESLINAGGFDGAELARAGAAAAMLRKLRLSKYNAAPAEVELPPGPYRLVIDQTVGDASIAGGLATAASFESMVETALAEADGQAVVAKLHPETLAGQKGGFLSRYRDDRRLTVIAVPGNPWELLARASRVYTVSSQLGFEALLAGKDVHCFGAPFYAGWGLTKDVLPLPRRTRRATVAEVFAAAYLRYCHYFDAWTRQPIDIETAIDQLAFLRDRFHENRKGVVLYRIPLWKRRPLERLLEGPCPPPRHVRRLDAAVGIARAEGRAIAAWGKTANMVRAEIRARGCEFISIEDGFLRSAGLGAALTPSLSYSFDRRGIYYDPSCDSDLEELLQSHPLDESLLARGRRLSAQIVSHDLSKYNLAGQVRLPALPEGRRRILVVGQVADDEAVLKSLSGSSGNVNEMILERVRQEAPEACVIYKPHPDVERLGRAGAIDSRTLARLADAVYSDVPITAALDSADEVAVFTSLAGFEALIRNKPVRTFGKPFYGGWGLTVDAEPFPRRTRRLPLDALVAIALIVYPRYLDPVSGLPCPVEVAVARLLAARQSRTGARARLGAAAGKGIILWRRLTGR